MINKVDEVGSSGLIVLERRGASTYLEECSVARSCNCNDALGSGHEGGRVG